jgi:hypothetical protein
VAYTIGQRVASRHGGGVLIVSKTLSDAALATTDGGTLAGPEFCQHRNRRVGHFEYFGGSNEGAHGLIDLAPGCRRGIDQWGPDGRFHRRPADLRFDQ